MNTLSSDARALAYSVAEKAKEFPDVEIGIAPPSLWSRTAVGAGESGPLLVFGQNASNKLSGARTGELSPAMWKSAGVNGVILGHSERRSIFGEDDALIAEKVALARQEKLDVILCIGESLEIRQAGNTLQVVLSQLKKGLSQLTKLDGVTIAYEPVWAIGTGVTATPEQAQEVHAAIRAWIRENFGEKAADSIRIQYGGSVKPNNAAEILAKPDIDGALVGGASLKLESFMAIVEAAK